MLPEGWYIDGVPLDDFGTLVESRVGWDDTPAARGENTVLPGFHGAAWRRKRFEQGRKTLTVGVHGCIDENFTIPAEESDQRAAYEASLDGLLRLITPRHRLVEVQRVHPDGTRHRADCEVVNRIEPATMGNTYGKVQFELIIPSAFFEDVDPQTYELAYDTGGADEQAVEVFSLSGQTAPCSDAVLTVTGGCTSLTIVDEESGSGFAYTDGVGVGEELVVDAGAFSAELDGVSVLTDLDLFTGELLEISPAPSAVRGPRLVVTAAGSDGAFSVTLVTRRKWLR